MTDALGADDLPLSALETRVQTEVVEFLAEIFGIEPGHLILEVIYINGSFGAEAATPESDIDMTVGFLANEAVSNLHHDEWIEASHKLSAHLASSGGRSLDVQAFPTADAITHVKRRCKHAGYDTAYSLGNRIYVPVTSLR